MKMNFSEYFDVEKKILEDYGTLDVSLINDLPLFIDPFQLFHSRKEEYQTLHKNIIEYVRFLKDKSDQDLIDVGLLRAWFCFPEVKQNWLGYSKAGNEGRGLGMDFARTLNKNLHIIFKNFGDENITKGSHLEKLCLIKEGVGRDNISDFTTNLIKDFLLNYTQNFTRKYLSKNNL